MGGMEPFVLTVAAIGGFIAGMISSVVGFGGGIILIASMSTLTSPQEAIALTAPAVLFGNLHRVWLFRTDLDRSVLTSFLYGAVPATLIGSVLLPYLPENGLRLTMGAFLLLFVTRDTLRLRPSVGRSSSPRLLIAGGFANGAAASTIGGGGPLSAPFLSAFGLVRGAFIVTEAAGNAVVQFLKVVVFTTSGLLTAGLLAATLAAMSSISIGNRIGKRLLGSVDDTLLRRIFRATLVILALRLILLALRTGCSSHRPRPATEHGPRCEPASARVVDAEQPPERLTAHEESGDRVARIVQRSTFKVRSQAAVGEGDTARNRVGVKGGRLDRVSPVALRRFDPRRTTILDIGVRLDRTVDGCVEGVDGAPEVQGIDTHLLGELLDGFRGHHAYARHVVLL